MQPVADKPHARVKAARRAKAATHDAEWAAAIEAQILRDCHPHQRDAVTDNHRRQSLLVGRGGGKTTTILAKFVIGMAKIAKASYVFVAPTKDMARELIWDQLKDTFERLQVRTGKDVTYNESRLTATLHRNGSRLKLVGADDRKELDKLRGKPYDGVAADEVAMWQIELVEIFVRRVVGPRLGERNGWLVLASTPGHILSGLFYDATRPGSEQHRSFADRFKPEYTGWTRWSSHAWTLEDGAKHVPALARLWAEALIEKESNGWSDDNPIWLREYKGLWAADDTENIYKYRVEVNGQLWNQWDPLRIGPMKVAKLPDDHTDWEYGFGHDLGVKDPFALQVFAFSPSDPKMMLYHAFEFEQPEMYSRSIAQLWLGEDDEAPLKVKPHEKPGGLIGALGWPAGACADLAGNGESIILELKRVYGINIIAAEKKGKFAAFELFNGHLIDGRIKILKGSKLESQLMQLQWRVNDVGEISENKAQANHSADAALYCIRLIGHLFDTGRAAPPPTATPHPAELPEPTRRIDDSADGWEYGGGGSSTSYDDSDEWGNPL